MVAISSFSNALKEAKVVYGTFMMLSSAWTARTVAGCGWDVSDADRVKWVYLITPVRDRRLRTW
jgi:2-keto-3-deoxy-L-rhamnonate aldolase RhmA